MDSLAFLIHSLALSESTGLNINTGIGLPTAIVQYVACFLSSSLGLTYSILKLAHRTLQYVLIVTHLLD